MMTDVDLMRHAAARGSIIRTLSEDYTAAMTSVRNLLGALDLQGISLSQADLEFHLSYLADSGYVQIWRTRDLPGYRNDRRVRDWMKPDSIMFAKLLPKGLQLLDGRIAEDPLIKF
jgi:hypothetical protein